MSDFRAVTTNEGATFEPWTDGHAVGFKVTAPGKPDRYIYLNPSGGVDTGDINDTDAFVYLSDSTEIDDAEPQCFVNIW